MDGFSSRWGRYGLKAFRGVRTTLAMSLSGTLRFDCFAATDCADRSRDLAEAKGVTLVAVSTPVHVVEELDRRCLKAMGLFGGGKGCCELTGANACFVDRDEARGICLNSQSF